MTCFTLDILAWTRWSPIGPSSGNVKFAVCTELRREIWVADKDLRITSLWVVYLETVEVMRSPRESKGQEEKMVNDLRSGRRREDSQKRETEANHTKRRRSRGAWHRIQEMSVSRTGLAHGPECFIEVEGDEDMDLEAITNAARSSVSLGWKTLRDAARSRRCQVERANGDLSLKMRTWHSHENFEKNKGRRQ